MKMLLDVLYQLSENLKCNVKFAHVGISIFQLIDDFDFIKRIKKIVDSVD